jgi:hypothetical protein
MTVSGWITRTRAILFLFARRGRHKRASVPVAINIAAIGHPFFRVSSASPAARPSFGRSYTRA